MVEASREALNESGRRRVSECEVLGVSEVGRSAVSTGGGSESIGVLVGGVGKSVRDLARSHRRIRGGGGVGGRGGCSEVSAGVGGDSGCWRRVGGCVD